MKSPRIFYLIYLSVVLFVLIGMVWFLPSTPWVSTTWIILNLFLLIYLFPNVLKLPKILLPNNEISSSKKVEEINLLTKIFQQLDQYILIIHYFFHVFTIIRYLKLTNHIFTKIIYCNNFLIH